MATIVLCILQGQSLLFAQGSIYAPLPPILKRALQYPGTIHISTLNTKTLIQPKDLPPSYKTNVQQIVKTSEGLFLFIDGTGRIYHYNTNSCFWDRIDSTVFIGYNFGAYFFKMGNTFYNFGGNGFWNYNGNIRNYNPFSHEWDAKPTNEYIVSVNYIDRGFHYLDLAHQYLWIKGPIVDPHHVKDIYKNAPYKNYLWKLHVPSGQWNMVGKMKDTGFFMVIQFKNGFYFNGGMADIVHNKYYKASENMVQKLYSINSASNKDNFFTFAFSIDSTLFFGNLEDRLDSLRILKSDFIDTGVPIYTPVEKSYSFNSIYLQWGGYIMLILSGGALGWWIGRKSKKAHTPLKEINTTEAESILEQDPTPIVTSPKPIIFKTGKDLAKLDEKEQRLVLHILQNCEEGRATPIEEINRVLGVAQRNPEIQKRMRSDMINSVNQKAQLLLKLNGPLITKRRSEFDKRSFEYFIDAPLIEAARIL